MCISNFGTRRPYPASAAFFHHEQKKQQITSASTYSSNSEDDAERLLAQLKQSLVDFTAESTCASTSVVPKSQSQHQRLIVTHNYHDHASLAPDQFDQNHHVRGGVTTPFPLKLHYMLNATQAAGMEDIVSWQPHGRCFVVHKPKEFVELLPEYFKLSKLPSFQVRYTDGGSVDCFALLCSVLVLTYSPPPVLLLTAPAQPLWLPTTDTGGRSWRILP